MSNKLTVLFLLCLLNGMVANSRQWKDVSLSLFNLIEGFESNNDVLNRETGTILVIPETGELIAVTNGINGLYSSMDHGTTWEKIEGAGIKGRSYGGFGVNLDYDNSRYVVFMVARGKNLSSTSIISSNSNKDIIHFDEPQYLRHDGWTWGMADWTREGIPEVILGKQHHAWVKLWLSTDFGKTWKLLDFESRNPGVINDSVFVAGNDDGMYRTTDQGKNWQKINSIKVTGKNPVKFRDDFYWTTERGVIRSSDNGKTWKLQGKELKGALWGPYFGKNKNWMMVVSPEGFFITQDGGEGWKKAAGFFNIPNSNKGGQYNLMHPTNSYGWDWKNKFIYAAGLGGHIYRRKIGSYTKGQAKAARPLTIPGGKPLIIRSIKFVKYARPRYGRKDPVTGAVEKYNRMACRIVAENGSFGLADWKTAGSHRADHQAVLVTDTDEYLARIEKVLVGKDARGVEQLHDLLPEEAKILVDRALWDLIGRDAGKPVHALFGTKRDEIKTYYSKGTIESFEEVQNTYGCDAWKIHAWPQEKEEELRKGATMHDHEPPLTPSSRCIEFFKQARGAVGEGVTIIADCHYHFIDEDDIQWTGEDAMELAKGLEKLDVLWMEGLPFVTDRPDLYKLLKKEVPGLCLQQEFPNSLSDIPMVSAGMDEYPEVIDVQAADPITMSFTEQVRFARWCIENGKFFDSHWPDYTSLQLAAAMTGDQYPLFEVGSGNHRDMKVGNGKLSAPTEPGLMPIRFSVNNKKDWQIADWEYILQHKIDHE